jgi:hypothetical protein
MLAYEQRLETACFERARQFADLDAVVGWEMEGANQHDYVLHEFHAPYPQRRADHPTPTRGTIGCPLRM